MIITAVDFQLLSLKTHLKDEELYLSSKTYGPIYFWTPGHTHYV